MSNCTHTEGKFHDCEYVERRNALIPVAERKANQYYPEHLRSGRSAMGPQTEARNGRDALFHAEMNRLAREEK